jgi:hypothetical protein
VLDIMKATIRLLACGGRYYDDAELVGIVLDRIHKETPISVLIHGDAAGADRLADAWAKRVGVSVDRYPADWLNLGRAAGPVRNQLMINEGKPDMVLAFPGGHGTRDMVDRARMAGLIVEHAAREAKDAHAALVDDIRRNERRSTSPLNTPEKP